MTLPINQIIQGDCIDVLLGFPDNSIDLVITDPPYKLSEKYGPTVDADNLSAVASIMQVMPAISRVLKKGRFAVVFYDNRLLPLIFQAAKGTELVYRRSIFLYRRWGLAHCWMGWMQCTDPICFFVKGGKRQFRPTILGKAHHDYYTKKGPERENTGHPAQKPIEIIKDIVSWCSNKGDVVLDPYVGSGTTCLAAKILNRKFIGIDIEKEYVEMSRSRVKTPMAISDFAV